MTRMYVVPHVSQGPTSCQNAVVFLLSLFLRRCFFACCLNGEMLFCCCLNGDALLSLKSRQLLSKTVLEGFFSIPTLWVDVF